MRPNGKQSGQIEYNSIHHICHLDVRLYRKDASPTGIDTTGTLLTSVTGPDGSTHYEIYGKLGPRRTTYPLTFVTQDNGKQEYFDYDSRGVLINATLRPVEVNLNQLC